MSQLPKLFGIEKGDGDTIRQLVHLLGHLGDARWPPRSSSAPPRSSSCSAPSASRREVPGGLVALVLGIAVSAASTCPRMASPSSATVPSGLPSLGVPDIDGGDVGALIAAAGGMVLVIYSESLGAAADVRRQARLRDRPEPGADRARRGQRRVRARRRAWPAAAAFRSRRSTRARAPVSEISPLVAAALVVVTVLLLTPLFKNLPEAVLAALIIHAVSHLMNVAEFRRYYAERRVEFWLALATLVAVITLDVLPALTIGVTRCCCS